MTCSGSSLKLTGITTFPESQNATSLWEATPAAWKQRFTITTGTATTMTVSWATEAESKEAEEHGGMIPNSRFLTGTAPTSRVCAATSPNAPIGEVMEGLATWVLPSPATSVTALMAMPPTNVNLNKLTLAFQILPNGTVPVFAPFS
jgi:hypothetical protein